jgi:hypothetical protein
VDEVVVKGLFEIGIVGHVAGLVIAGGFDLGT